jgi:GT2 family glycosyltransferase
LFVASTGTNEIVEIDLHNNSIRRHGFPGTGDAWHINCLAEFNGEIIFSAFGKFSEDRGYKGQTLGNGFVASLLSGKELIRGLSQPHSLLVSGGHLYVIDSETGCLNEYDSGFCLKRSLSLGLYPRGLLIRHGVIFVGLSASRNIDGSTVSSAQLLAIDHVDFEKKASLELDAKEIYAVSHLHANPQMTLFVSAANRSACQLQSTRTRLAELQGEHERVGAWGRAQERELQSMRTQLAELQGEHERVAAWGQAQGRELQSTRAQLAELQGEHERVAAWGQAQERELQSTRAQLAELQGEHERVVAWGQAQERELQSVRAQLEELQSAYADIEAHARSLDTALQDRTAHCVRLQQESAQNLLDRKASQLQLEKILRSRSWAITKPLRVAGRILRGEWDVVRAGLQRRRNRTAAMRPARGADDDPAPRNVAYRVHHDRVRSRGRIGAFVERCYRALPISGTRKRELKGLVFRSTGRLFASTSAYRRWQAHDRTRAPDTARPHDTAIVQVQSVAAPLTAPAALPQELWRADGTREWQDYPLVRARIEAITQRQREEKQPAPHPLIAVDPCKCANAAARIRLPKPRERPDVTVLIPVFNHLSTTLECLASIAEHSDAGGPDFEVLVANDGSTDATARILADIPNLRLVNQPQNLGFLRNCNTAAKHARGRLLVLLNNDVQVTAGWLAALVECLESCTDIGAVGPRIVYPSGWLQEAGTRLLRDGSAELVGLNDLPDLPRYRYSRDVDYCSGACLLLRTADFERLRGFDECFVPAYCEDSDLCMRLRAEGKRIVYCAGVTVVHRLSTTSDSIPGDYKLRCIARNLTTFAARWQADLDRLDSVRTIAFYLPQFHPIAENDRWWGPGFTEWTNVVKARPNFVGHDQPRLPTELGYYDLRLPEVMEQQAALAKRYGLGGFCYYYYWFAGHRLLERPLEAMLANPRMQFPFCLCWANENWTRRWDGNEQDVLMAQQHSDADDEAVIRDLLRYFRSPNYIRIGGRPLIAVYRVGLFPDFKRTAALWRQVCRDAGIGDPYIAQVESFEMVTAGIRPQDVGCDAAIEFPPHGMADPYPLSAPLLNPEFHGAVADYRDLAVRCATRELPAYKRFLGVATGWDNTARRQNNSYCFEHATPGAFQAWLETAIERTKQQFSGDERLVFINAWNEWAEGAYLEPDQRFGHAFLQAHANAHDAAHLMRHGRYSLG